MIYKSKIIVLAKLLINDDKWKTKSIKKDSIVNVEWMGSGAVQFKTEDDKLFQLPLNEFLFAFVEMEMVSVVFDVCDSRGVRSHCPGEELREVTK